MSENPSVEERNKNMVKTSFDHWKDGTGSPFELLDAEARWTIVGTSPLSRTYGSRQEFLDKVINPFNARMSKRLIPSVRGLYADGDTVVILFDGTATARDGRPYRNTYTWYLTIEDAKVVSVIALFDSSNHRPRCSDPIRFSCARVCQFAIGKGRVRSTEYSGD
jgi:ketosteroid isomerase-like protein